MWVRGWTAIAALVAVSGCDIVYSLDRPKPPPGEWAHVAAGEHHTCGIKTNGTLWCWGLNAFGAVGVSEAVVYLDVPSQIGGSSWLEISARHRTTCGIQSDNTLWCWGYNAMGQVGTQAPDLGVFTPQFVEGGPWKHVATGIDHTCAIGTDGSLWCWGQGAYGQLGDGLRQSSGEPVRVAGEGWTEVVTGFDHTCGMQGSAVSCWGSNYFGQLADPTIGDRDTPHAIDGEWSQVAAGDGVTCLRDRDGASTCFGLNTTGQLGNGSTRNNKIGSPLGSDTGWSQLAIGRSHACGLRDGTMWCWGASGHGEIPSDKRGEVVSLPLAITQLDLNWTELSLGLRHTCALDDGHRLYCAGQNANDELGQGGANIARGVPSRVEGEWKDVKLGEAFTCALATDGTVSCWGRNDAFQLGDGTEQPKQQPAQVRRIDAAVTELVVGDKVACVRGDAADVRYCWGINEWSEIGDEATQPSTTAAEVPREIHDKWFPSQMSSHTCGFDSTPAAACWGVNYMGQVGVGTFDTFYPKPERLSTMHTFSKLFVNGNHSCGIDNGILACWGDNGWGQLGINSRTMRSTPADVGGLVGVESAALGEAHTCAVMAGGAAACWGLDNFGQLGLGTLDSHDLPQPISGTWRQLSAGDAHTCGIQQDGTLWCWGANTKGQLGDGTFTQRTAPTQIGTRSDWTRVSGGDEHTCALAGAELWCWGEDSDGQLGTGNAWRDELVRVPD